jgi:hypothetical protein
MNYDAVYGAWFVGDGPWLSVCGLWCMVKPFMINFGTWFMVLCTPLLSAASMSAPAARIREAAGIALAASAVKTGVMPALSRASTAHLIAPTSPTRTSSSSTQWQQPALAASCSGVAPLLSATIGSAPRSQRAAAICGWALNTAVWRGVRRLLV